jgi:hypothetical protein
MFLSDLIYGIKGKIDNADPFFTACEEESTAL